MPLVYSLATSPRGRQVAVSVASGEVTLADAEHSAHELGPQGRFHRMPSVALVDSSATFSPESRKRFAAMEDVTSPVAIVVSSAATRVLLNFIIKASALKAAALGGPTPVPVQFFNSQPDAMAWVDTLPESP
jgi:hypothetical protein